MDDIEKQENKIERILSNKPDTKWFWRGLGGNFDNLTQILCEFVDNSFSNFIKYNQSEVKKIIIRIDDKTDNLYNISIEDTGTGINDLNAAFSIGSRKAQETSLNEHGFGMKHALAAANITNDNWCVQTRTSENANRKIYTEISCPYDYEEQKAFEYHSDGWPGIQKTGTIVNFTIDNHLFKTITKGIRGDLVRQFGVENIAGVNPVQ